MYFFEKKNQKLLRPVGCSPEESATAQIRVFRFSFTKKKAFLHVKCRLARCASKSAASSLLPVAATSKSKKPMRLSLAWTCWPSQTTNRERSPRANDAPRLGKARRAAAMAPCVWEERLRRTRGVGRGAQNLDHRGELASVGAGGAAGMHREIRTLTVDWLFRQFSSAGRLCDRLTGRCFAWPQR